MKAELIDRMGTDLTVVNAARVSFDKESDWEYQLQFKEEGKSWDPSGEVLSEKDQKLIKYLAQHNHWTPFSHVTVQMRETVPIFVARQRFKHMVGFTYNEVSRRYVDDAPEFFRPDAWRKAPTGGAKQGSSDEAITAFKNGVSLQTEYNAFLFEAERLYFDMLEAGVAPEQARMVLPQSMYTSYYVTGSLAAWARAYKLRIDPHAQKEIRDLAKQWSGIIGGIQELKHSWSALIGSASSI